MTPTTAFADYRAAAEAYDAALEDYRNVFGAFDLIRRKHIAGKVSDAVYFGCKADLDAKDAVMGALAARVADAADACHAAGVPADRNGDPIDPATIAAAPVQLALF